MSIFIVILAVFNARAAIEVYSESQGSTRDSNFVFSGHLKYKKMGAAIEPNVAAYVTSDSNSEANNIFNDRFFAVGIGAMITPFSWAKLITEYRWVESQFKDQNGYSPHDARVLAMAGKDWILVPKGPGRAVVQAYGESVFSSRLKSNIFNTGYLSAGYDLGKRMVAKPYVEIRARRDALQWSGENTNESRIGLNFGASLQSLRWNVFVYQADRFELISERSIQEFAALVTIGGSLL